MKGKSHSGFMSFGRYLLLATLEIRKLEELTELQQIKTIRRATMGFYFTAIPFAAACLFLYNLLIPRSANLSWLLGALCIVLPYAISFCLFLPAHCKIYKRLRANFEAMQFMFGKTEENQ